MRDLSHHFVSRVVACAAAAIAVAAMAAPPAGAATPHPHTPRPRTSPFPLTNGAVFHPDGRTRILDTRHAIGVPTTTPVPAGATIELNVAGVDGLPSSGLGAVTLNLAATDTAAAGSLIAYTSTLGGGIYQPTSPDLSWSAGQTVSELTTVGLNFDGPIEIQNSSSGTVDIVADLAGYYTNDGREAARPGPTYVPITPARVLDTRHAIGVATTTPVPPDGTVQFPVGGVGAVPASGVLAVVLNITATDTAGLGYLTAYQGGQTRPPTSNLNWVPGQTAANLAIVPIGLAGTVGVTTSSGAPVDLIADVVGYFTEADTNAVYETITPTRVFSTTVPGNGTVSVQPASWSAGLPAPDTRAVELHVTAGNSTGIGYLTIYPDGVTRPNTSNLNWTAGSTAYNDVIAGVGSDGKIDLHNNGAQAVTVTGNAYGAFTSAPDTPADPAVSPTASDGSACDTTSPGGIVTPVSSGGHTGITLTADIANQATWTGTMNAHFTVTASGTKSTYDSPAVSSDQYAQPATVTITDPAPGSYSWSAVTQTGGRSSAATSLCYFRIQ